MELPNTTSGALTPAFTSDAALPSPVGTSSSLLVMTPPTTWARAEMTREGGTLKPRTPSSITQLLVELTTQVSVPRSFKEETRAYIWGKILSRKWDWKKEAAVRRNSASFTPS